MYNYLSKQQARVETLLSMDFYRIGRKYFGIGFNKRNFGLITNNIKRFSMSAYLDMNKTAEMLAYFGFSNYYDSIKNAYTSKIF